MERILTNSQVEWLSNIRLLSEYEDDSFPKENMSEKLSSFIESEYPGMEESIVRDLEVLAEKGFLILKADFEVAGVSVSEVNITHRGLDYLIMLEEDFAEKIAINDNLVKSISQLTSKKDTLDYIVQLSTIASNVVGLAPTIGNFCQGAIPVTKKLGEIVLKKLSNMGTN